MSYFTALENTACPAVFPCILENGSSESSHPDDRFLDSFCNQILIMSGSMCVVACGNVSYQHL